MKKLLIICALFLSFSAVKAEEVITIHLNNSPAKDITLANIQKITFDANGLNVICYDQNNTSYNFADIAKITFGEGVGIESIMATNTSIVVAPNPTKNYLMIEGADDLYGSDLNIYSISGSIVSKYNNWNGERVDVSQLNAGIYFVNVGATTVKFVKQ